MNIGELFVRVTGDTSDFARQMGGAQRALGGFEKSATSAHLRTGRLTNAFEAMASRLFGVPPIVGKVSAVLSEFAVGGAITLGVVAGVTAIAVVWDKLTEGTRKAREEADKLSASLLNQAKAIQAASIEGRRKAVDDANANLAAAKAALANPFSRGSTASLQAAVEDAATEAQMAVNNLGSAIAHLNDSGMASASAHAKAVGEVTGKYNELRDAADRVNAAMMKDNKDWWKSYIDSGNEALSIFRQLENAKMAAQPSLIESLQSLGQVGQTIPTFSMPKVGLDDGLTKEQIKSRDALIGNADKNKDAMVNAIMTSASIIVGALNIGGGGRGSSIGSALGGALGGAALGGKLGAFGGPLGAIGGALAGSLIGGLFDNSSATRENTSVTRQLTQALLLHAPGGFKTASLRYDATDVQRMADAARRLARRGGSPILGTT